MIHALVVLALAFGALFAAITPIVTALVAISIDCDITRLISHVLTIVSFAPILGVLIGLGVGSDHTLFIVTRHRSAVLAGRSIEDAAVNAVSTAGQDARQPRNHAAIAARPWPSVETPTVRADRPDCAH